MFLLLYLAVFFSSDLACFWKAMPEQAPRPQAPSPFAAFTRADERQQTRPQDTGPQRPSSAKAHSLALIPLVPCALFLISGIVLVHFVYLRPGLLLAGMAPLAAVAAAAIWRAPRMTWLALGAIWMVLGAWSGETEADPAVAPAVNRLSDSLLRTVQGTVAEAGPVHSDDSPATDTAVESGPDQPGDSADTGEPAQDVPSRVRLHPYQQLDVELAAAETVTDASDSIEPIPAAQSGRLRLTVRWPAVAASTQLKAALLPAVQCGQTIRAVVRMGTPDSYHDPGVWDRFAYLQSQQISATAEVDADKLDGVQPRFETIRAASADRAGRQSAVWPSAACLLNGWRDAATARLQSLPAITHWLPRPLRATPGDAAMLTAMLTGDRTWLTRPLRTGFERTGSFHLIVVSGLHLAILAGCVMALARRFRLPRLAGTMLTLAATLSYALFTGFEVPAQRAFAMITLYLLGRLLYRERSPLNVIGFAAIALLAASPQSLFDASLVMTLLSVASIAGIALPLLELNLRPLIRATRDLGVISIDPRLPPHIAQFRVTLRLLARHIAAAAGPKSETRLEAQPERRLERQLGRWLGWDAMTLALRTVLRLAELVFITLVVELALALPMAIYFHRITLYALPVNLCILPLLLLLVPAAMMTLIVLAAAPALAPIPAAVCLGLLHFSVAIVRALGGLQLGDLRIPGPGTLQIAASLVAFVAAIFLARGVFVLGWQFHRRLAALALAAMTACALWPRPVARPAEALLMQTIDVGQGDSILLITPDGKTLLIDGGGIGLPYTRSPSRGTAKTQTPAQSDTPAESAFDTGEDIVSPVLWSRGIRRLDAVALTHAHHDHMGGLPAILRNFRPRELWVGNNPPVADYVALLRQAAQVGTQIRFLRAGQTIPLGRANFRVLAPLPAYRPGPEPANDDSLVLKASYAATSILLEGDAEAPEEDTILPEGDLSSTVLKVGHHGSLTSTRPELLAQVAPAWAVISCGRHNRYGHPRLEILARLQAAHVKTYRTDIDGAVCFVLDGKAVTAQPMCR